MNLNQAIQLGAQLLGAGRFADAKNLCAQVVAQVPQNPDAHHFLGLACHSLGESLDGVRHIQKAIQLDTSQPSFHANLGHVLRESGRVEEAVTYYNNALHLQEGHVQALLGLGQCALAMQKPRDALSYFADAEKAGLAQGVVITQCALAYVMLGNVGEAIAQVAAYLKDAPEDAMALSTLGSLYQTEEMFEEAKEAYAASHALAPSVMSASNLGAVYMMLGDMAQARVLLEEAIALHKTHGAAYYHLAHVVDAEAFAPYAQKITALLETETLGADDEARLYFALYRYYKKAGDKPQAIQALLKGNALYAQKVPFDLKGKKALFKKAVEVVPPARLDELKAQGHSSDAPIFIVGMPRSGTTLTEQILSSHPQVQGMGELKYISHVLNGAPYVQGQYQNLTDADFAKKAEMYLEKVQSRGWDGAGRFTDKMPSNFLYVPAIRAMFPKAKIIHMRRHPMATCFSNFEQMFAEGQQFSYTQERLGAYYGLYHELMQRFEKMDALNMLTISYEDLVEDTEGVVRKLLEYCELPWDEVVLSFYQQKRTVQTASATQVRSPIYKGSLSGWTAYTEELASLQKALEKAGVL